MSQDETVLFTTAVSEVKREEKGTGKEKSKNEEVQATSLAKKRSAEEMIGEGGAAVVAGIEGEAAPAPIQPPSPRPQLIAKKSEKREISAMKVGGKDRCT